MTEMEEFEVGIPTVEIITESFCAKAIEMYELPSGMIMQMLSLPGPAQIKMMAKLFKMALIDPQVEADIDGLSFNELTEVLYQWYSQSPVRIGKKMMPSVTLEDIIGPPENDDEPF